MAMIAEWLVRISWLTGTRCGAVFAGLFCFAPSVPFAYDGFMGVRVEGRSWEALNPLGWGVVSWRDGLLNGTDSGRVHRDEAGMGEN